MVGVNSASDPSVLLASHVVGTIVTVSYTHLMLELGSHTAEEHSAIIHLTKQLILNDVIFIGKNFSEVKDEQHGVYFENVQAAKSYFEKRDITNTTILLKGSRGIAVEKLLE